MKKTRLLLCFMLMLVISHTGFAQTLLHYWNFNNSTSQVTLLTPTVSMVPGDSISYIAGGTSAIQITSNTTGQGFEVTNPNARNGDTAGAHLRFNNPIGGTLIFSLPTTGYKDAIIKYATRRSGSGAGSQLIDYTIDGTNYIAFDTIAPVDGNPTLQTLDFSSISATDNNPNFKIKITFQQGAGGTVGNNRFDNFTLEGTILPSLALVHYWNFNSSATVTDLLTPTSSVVSGSAIVHLTGGISAVQNISNTGQGFDITNPNTRNGDGALTHLRFNDPIGGGLIFSLPTNGYEDVIVKFATRRSGSGAGSQLIDYTTDGTNYTRLDTLFPIDGNPTLQTLDFSGIAATDNNPDFKIKITFEQGPGGLVGNNRFDNFTLEGISNGSTVDTLAPTITFDPVNNAVNVAVSVVPVLTFSEPARLINNTLLDNTNVDTLVSLILNDGSLTQVPFDASVAGNSIVIVPNNLLQNNKEYALTLKGNVIEDFVDNDITSPAGITFLTIAVQTVFQPGDIVPVAYRMNATSTDDEVALLTLVDILPGTMINLTDAKYTDNTPAQCAGGLVWTAPSSGVAAGTVIGIKNDAGTASIGTLTGASFGLSSGGDQMIVYTGTAAAPSYITALSSNAWLTNNTSCSGSNSKLPATLTDGTSAINLSTATGNVAGNTVNAYYNGTQNGTVAQLKTAVLNPANWIGTDAGTAPQTWPVWAFPGPPSVVSAKVLTSTSIQVIFNRDLDNATATSIVNFTGITGLTTITRTTNGTLADTLVLNFSTSFSSGVTYNLLIAGVKDTENRTMFGTYTFSFTYNTTIAFNKKFISVKEDAGSVNIILNLENPSVSSIDVVVKSAPFSTAASADFTYTGQTLNFTGSSNSTQTISIPVINDNTEEQDEYFVISLENASGASLSGSQYITVYIKDNDHKAPVATEEIELSYVNSFKPVSAGGSTTEIVVHDAASQKLFMTSAIEKRLDIADFSNPAAIAFIKSVDMTPYGGITSVAVKNGVVAVACPNADEQQNGSVVFFNTNGDFQKQVTVGALPDMITFSPDGNYILTANEGQPNDAYTIDPEGSVSIIDISGGLASVDQSKVNTLLFTSFNANETALINSGVRKLKITSTLSQDFEPEYITISDDSKKAWVTLQENNAIAEVNLDTKIITSVTALGTKDYSLMGNGIDASDNSGIITISNWPVKAFFIPDAIANYTVGTNTYLVTANEGDEKEYSGLTERTTVGNNGTILDPVAYPNAALLKEDHNIGRMRITNRNGDTDGDGDYDQLYVNGSRSFTIWNATTKALVYDSGDDFEMITSSDTSVSPIFNADNEGNGFKSRSRAKGPEPEGVTVAKIGTEVYAFVALERIGGVMVYNITDPSDVKFVDYKNSRSIVSFAGDHGPEGIIYISKQNSPDGKAYIAVANEISGTISVYELLNIPNPVGFDHHETIKELNAYPNPVNGNELHFNKMITFKLYDVLGKEIAEYINVNAIDVTNFKNGIYVIKTSEGEVKKIIIN
jgi:hypothetical protein